MKINSNIIAIQTVNSLGKANNAAAKAMERLSSGLRINSAADDAAGLAIANKMDTQVKGLSQANRNAMDGVSMIQTAEGALDEVHSMLQRMRQLTVQAATGSNGDTDKDTIMNEVDELIKEIEAIQDRSQFNTMNLLDGTYSNFTLQVGANKDQSMEINGDSMSLSSVLVNLTGVSSDRVQGGFNAPGNRFEIPEGSRVVVDGEVVDLNSESVNLKEGSVISVELSEARTFKIDGNNVTVPKGEKLIFRIGANDAGKTLDANGNIPISTDTTMTTAKTGALGGVSQRLFNYNSTADTDKAIRKMDEAISQTSVIRARLGAYQNRLEHTVTNLATSEENMTASLSRIQDADMAEEMTNYTQYNVIAQAATAMLAQANQRPQQVLQLLNS